MIGQDTKKGWLLIIQKRGETSLNYVGEINRQMVSAGKTPLPRQSIIYSVSM